MTTERTVSGEMHGAAGIPGFFLTHRGTPVTIKHAKLESSSKNKRRVRMAELLVL